MPSRAWRRFHATLAVGLGAADMHRLALVLQIAAEYLVAQTHANRHCECHGDADAAGLKAAE